VGFVAHPNPQIRQVAVENLVPYSTAEPDVFKTENLKPVKNLTLLIRDHPVSATRLFSPKILVAWI
jgi:hypothetical protein